jgi:hypothetical protein
VEVAEKLQGTQLRFAKNAPMVIMIIFQIQNVPTAKVGCLSRNLIQKTTQGHCC